MERLLAQHRNVTRRRPRRGTMASDVGLENLERNPVAVMGQSLPPSLEALPPTAVDPRVQWNPPPRETLGIRQQGVESAGPEAATRGGGGHG